jgi:hypothetical protein
LDQWFDCAAYCAEAAEPQLLTFYFVPSLFSRCANSGWIQTLELWIIGLIVLQAA